LTRICEALAQIVRRNREVEVVFPVHPNPNVRAMVNGMLRGKERVHLCDPLRYDEFVEALVESDIILTDSGGIQEEAPVLGKPVLVVREKTERIEAVEAGVSKLVGTDVETIVREVETLLHDEAKYRKMARAVCPYGDGRASERIATILLGGKAEDFEPDDQGWACA